MIKKYKPIEYISWKDYIKDKYPCRYMQFKDKPISWYWVALQMARKEFNVYSESIACNDMQAM